MFSLAAKLAIVAAASSQQASTREIAAWRKIEPSIVLISTISGRQVPAALIDARGYFVVQRSSLGAGSTFHGQFYNGENIYLTAYRSDPASGLMLLKSNGPIEDHAAAPIPFGVPEHIDSNHVVPLIAALPTGPLKATWVSANHLGISNNSRAGMRLSEVQFEAPTNLVGGAPIFTLDGSLVGVLQATLASPVAEPDVATGFAAKPGIAGAAGGWSQARGLSRFGPAGMTVAYSPTPDTLARVVSGLMGQSELVERPAIGVFCKNASGHGALVDSVQPGSPAEAAGILAGDIITLVGGVRVYSQVGFAKQMLQQRVGSRVVVTVSRNRVRKDLHVRVGM